MHFLWMALCGLIIGAIARLLMPGPDPLGCLLTMALGIVGSIVAGFLGQLLGFYGPGDKAGFIMSVLGAMLVLWIYRRFIHNRA